MSEKQHRLITTNVILTKAKECIEDRCTEAKALKDGRLWAFWLKVGDQFIGTDPMATLLYEKGSLYHTLFQYGAFIELDKKNIYLEADTNIITRIERRED